MQAEREAVRAALISQHRDFAVAELASATDLSEDAVQRALADLAAAGEAVTCPEGLWLSDAAMLRLRATARRHLAAYHRRNPYERVMTLRALAPLLEKAAVVRDLPAVLRSLESAGELVVEENGIRLPDHAVTLPPGWRTAADEILAVFRESGLRPPPPAFVQRHYPRDIHVPTLLGILAEQGLLVQVAEDLFYTPEAIAEAQGALRRLCAAGEEITVSSVRDATGSTRKYAAPLLEYFDSVGFTRKSGDGRILASGR